MNGTLDCEAMLEYTSNHITSPQSFMAGIVFSMTCTHWRSSQMHRSDNTLHHFLPAASIRCSLLSTCHVSYSHIRASIACALPCLFDCPRPSAHSFLCAMQKSISCGMAYVCNSRDLPHSAILGWHSNFAASGPCTSWFLYELNAQIVVFGQRSNTR